MSGGFAVNHEKPDAKFLCCRFLLDANHHMKLCGDLYQETLHHVTFACMF